MEKEREGNGMDIVAWRIKSKRTKGFSRGNEMLSDVLLPRLEVSPGVEAMWIDDRFPFSSFSFSSLSLDLLSIVTEDLLGTLSSRLSSTTSQWQNQHEGRAANVKMQSHEIDESEASWATHGE